MNTVTSIYGLIDPMTSQIRYVGKSDDPKRRYREHIKNAKNGCKRYKHDWIRSLFKKGREPVLIILQHYVKDWRKAEQFWVQYYKDKGHKLTNLAPAGIGFDITEEAREKMSIAQKKKWQDPEHRRKMSEAQKKYFRDNPEARERVGEAGKGRIPWNKGMPMTDEIKKKVSKSRQGILRGIARSEVTKEKIRQKVKEIWADPKYKERLKKVMDKVWDDPERRRKISESHKGMKFTDEHRKNIGLAVKRRSQKTTQPLTI